MSGTWPGKALKGGTLVKKRVANGKIRKQRFRFEHVIFKRFHIKRNKIVKDFKQCLDN